MSRLIVGPFNRVEGDLEVRLDVRDGQVAEARVSSPLYRGFEQMLVGRDPRDALVYTPRICGICSVSQSFASARALAAAMQVTPPANGQLCMDLLSATENVADHVTHFYLFFMPDFARAVYAEEPWFAEAERRFKAGAGKASAAMLSARTEFMHIMGTLGGKWPHTLTLQPGGSARAVQSAEQVRLRALVFGFQEFLERQAFGDELQRFAALESEAQLRAWMDEAPWDSSDLRVFLHASDALGLEKLGRAADQFMSYGAYGNDTDRLFPAGLWINGPAELDPATITEDLSHAWLQGPDEPLHPSRGVTLPEARDETAYTWCKAPRLAGQVVEVGALARQLLAGHPLIVDLVGRSGGNVRNRVVARWLECARLLPQMQDWIGALQRGDPYCQEGPVPDAGHGVGLVEAARGSLGHWLEIRDGRIGNYQIISPTTWNFSPRDAADTAGPLEQALVGTPVRSGEKEPVAVQHVVRSFDPCMVCTVH